MNEVNKVNWRTFDIKIMTCSPGVRNVRSLLHVVKTDKKSRCMEKQEVPNYMCIWYASLERFQAFSILL